MHPATPYRSLGPYCVLFHLLIVALVAQDSNFLRVSTLSEWESVMENSESTLLLEQFDIGGEFDLLGDGGLLLEKQSDTHFTRSTDFVETGIWQSDWMVHDGAVELARIDLQSILYGHPIDMRSGWVKFGGNPVISGSGSNFIPSDENTTDQTIMLPEQPGGCPQDQAILRGSGAFSNKWIMLFNHTPSIWPNDYSWSMAIADSLGFLKSGINPFSLYIDQFPLFGPIDNHAPNDWIEIGGRYYAPDETYSLQPNMWVSDDLLSWTNLGEIVGLQGHDPGIVYDGEDFHLFSEDGSNITHCVLDTGLIQTFENETVMELGSHTGDADVSFFNNGWHMVYDNGPHLHYEIGYAYTTIEAFPRGWVKDEKIYGPHNPEQGQAWDDDTDAGNLFGTGDADLALEDNTLYMFTERPIGAAWKVLSDLWELEETGILLQIWADNDLDGIADDSTGWHSIPYGPVSWNLPTPLNGQAFKIDVQLTGDGQGESPLIQSLAFSAQARPATRLKLVTDKDVLLPQGDTLATLSCFVLDHMGQQISDGERVINFNSAGNGIIDGGFSQTASSGAIYTSFALASGTISEFGDIPIIASSPGLQSDTAWIEIRDYLLVDDFEEYLNPDLILETWPTYPGLTAEIALLEADDNAVLQFDYGIANGNPPYSGFYSDLNQAYALGQNLEFELRGDASGRNLIVRLSEVGGTYWDHNLILSDSSWQNVHLGTWQFQANDGSSSIDFGNLSRLSFLVTLGAAEGGEGSILFDDIIFGLYGSTNVEDEKAMQPIAMHLKPIYPNPFNASTRIEYQIPQNKEAVLNIYAITGQRVLSRDIKGSTHFDWDASGFASGVYLIQISANQEIQTRKALLLK